jgi:hypothetical protein
MADDLPIGCPPAGRWCARHFLTAISKPLQHLRALLAGWKAGMTSS